MEGLEVGRVVAARGDRLGAEQVGVWVGTGPRNLRSVSSGPRGRSAEAGAVGV